MRIWITLLILVSLAGAAETKKPSARGAAVPSRTIADSGRLPVRKVVLYKSGVGYFEHRGPIHGDQDVSVDFNSSQLNDVLSTLTVLDLGQGHVTGVSFNSSAPLANQLANMRLPLGATPTRLDFLGALRGARLEVKQGGSTVVGRVLSLDSRDRTLKDDKTEQVNELTLVTDNGDVRTFEVTPALNIRMVERELTSDVGRFLSTIDRSKNQNQRRMTVSTTGAGSRDLMVSYLSEVPVWKSTYRIVLPTQKERTAGEKPLLQGWAVVDNTVGEDWNNVELSLVAGAPQSFIQPLSQPQYLRRPSVGLPQGFQVSPQTHESALSEGADQASLPSAGPAESSVRGNLSGVLVDPSGAVIAGARVTISGPSGTKTDTTNQDGQFLFPLLSPGYYWVSAERSGFRKAFVRQVEVVTGKTSNLRVGMQSGAATETVEVAGNTVTVDTTSASVASNLTDKFYSSVPVDRGVSGVFYASPGVTAGGGTGSVQAEYGKSTGGIVGGTGMENPYVADGTNITEGGFGGIGVYSRVYGNVPSMARDLGDLFEYKLSHPVTIAKNQSALVPILQARVDADLVTVWNANSIPLRALWIDNSSGLTLDNGSFTVLDDGAFAGQGLLSHIKPGEKRILSYAADLGLHVDSESSDANQQPVTKVVIKKGVMTQTSEAQSSITYTIRNEDPKVKTVVIEHPARSGWALEAKGPQPEETSANFHRFRLKVDSKETTKLTLNEKHELSTLYYISSVTPQTINMWISRQDRDPKLEAALRPIMDKKNAISLIDGRINIANSEIQRIYSDQGRVRENLKSLKGSAEERALTQRYAKQLGQQEDEVQSERDQIKHLEEERNTANTDLNKLIDDLDLEATM